MADISISYLYTLKDKFSGKIKDINRNLSKNKKLIKSMNADLNKFSGSFAKVALVGTAAFTGLTVAAAKFESGVNTVKTLLDKPIIKKFSVDLDKAAKGAIGLGFSMADTNESLFDAVSAIGDVPKSLEVFNKAQILAIAGETSLNIATDGITSVMNAYSLSLEEAGDISNAFFTAQKKGKTTVAELASNVGKVAPVAKRAGIGFKTLLATMSQLTLGGLSTEEATTALRSAISGLLDPTPQVRKEIARLNEEFKLHIPIGASALAATNFTDVLGDLAIVAEKDKDALGLLVPNVRAVTAIAALGTEQIENLKKIIAKINEDIKNGTGLNEAYALKIQETSLRAKRAKGAFTNLSVTFGTKLLPATNKVLDATTKLLNKFTALSPETQKFILGIGEATTAFAALAVGIVAVQKVSPAVIATVSLLSKTFLLVANPITLLVAGLAGAVVLISILEKKSRAFAELMKTTFGLLKKLSKITLVDVVTGINTKKEEAQRRRSIIGEKLGRIGVADDLIGLTAQGQRGFFEANINIKAPKGSLQSVESKEKKIPFMNLGLNLQEV